MFRPKFSFSMTMLLILATALTVTGVSRGVICKATPAPPSPVGDAKMQVAINCALNCMKSGDSTCASNGFAVNWDNPGCHDHGASLSVKSDYACVVS